MKPKTIAILIVLALFIIVLLQNMDNIVLQLLLWNIQMPLLILILSSVFLGWIVGWFTHVTYHRGKQKTTSEKTKVKKTVATKQKVNKEDQPTETEEGE